jgi:phenylacetate-CoA ligase
VVVPSGTGNTETQIEIAKAVGATGFVGTPSFLMTLLKRAEEMKVGRLPFEVAQVGAEALPESLRRSLEDDYGVMTRQGFGTADIGMVAYECVEKTGMHLVDEAIVQVCDPQTGEPLPVGQIGDSWPPAQPHVPMIRRHRRPTVITDERCPCGRTRAQLGWRAGRRGHEGADVHSSTAGGRGCRPRDRRRAISGGRARGAPGHGPWCGVGPGMTAESVRSPLEAAIRDVMKLRGSVTSARGTIPERKIDDRRTWD